MQTGSKYHAKLESEIYDDLTLYKVVNTKKGRPVVVHLDGSVSVVLKFEGLNNTAFAESDFERMFKRMQSTLDDVQNPAISIQFVMIRDNNIEHLDDNIEKLPSFLKPRAEYLKQLASEYKLFTNRFYLAVYCSTDKTRTKDVIKRAWSKLVGKDSWKVDSFTKVLNGLEERMNSVLEVSDLLSQMIADVGSSSTVFTEKSQYYDLWQRFTRPDKCKDEFIKIDDTKESPRQVLFSGVRANVYKNDFELDNYYHKVWTLDRAPQDLIYGRSIDVIESMPAEFIYSLTFKSVPNKEAIDAFKIKLAEKRILAGGNAGAIIEDRTLIAEEQRISGSYDEFAFGNASGTWASAQFVMRIHKDVLSRMARNEKLSKEEVIQRLDQSIVKKIFSRFGFSEWANEEMTTWPVFCQCIPGFSNINSGILKLLFLSTANIPYFIAMYENKRPLEHNGTNHFIDNRGNIVLFDLQDPKLPAWNYSISGQTGSGKSVLMNTILDMQFADLASTGKKPVICILDVGGDRGSYQKFMRLINGTEINLSGVVKPSIQMFELNAERSNPTPDKVKEIAEMLHLAKPEIKLAKFADLVRAFYTEQLNVGLNNMVEYDRKKLFADTFGFEETPEFRKSMSLTPGKCEPDSRSFNLIMGVLDVMLSSNVKRIDGFEFFDYDEVSTLVLDTYRTTPGRYPFLSDLVQLAQQQTRPGSDEERLRSKKFLMKLKNWTREGANPMFDQETSVDTSNDVILADLKGLESNPQLQVVYTLLISQIFNEKMYFVRDRRKLMVRDEAWSIMQNERARRYFVEDLRTARKNGFATIAISQLPTDYLTPDPAAGRAIISNMQVQIFCKFSSEKFCQEIGSEFGLSEEVVREMTTLGLVKQQQADGSTKALYSKFMMIMENKEVYTLFNMLHPFEYILYSSSAEDNAVIDFYMRVQKSHTNLEDVLWLIARGQHLGDAALIDFLEKAGYNNMARRVRGGDKQKKRT
jgi:hypothetical protein